MATLLKVLNNLADIKSAGGVALRVRTQGIRWQKRVIPTAALNMQQNAIATCSTASPARWAGAGIHLTTPKWGAS
jgi:hypothetical protein